ncbi:heterokaryon incompatibility protein [Colletotrichum graminicola]|uniref:Heterokaryon incompatibility protein n=1 Tax=Colletotrichum graminicola (strain M1.001 / M2 / FGSC 10212) TaxID=645133 RepID=E3QNR9_COLGM|nr:heterokaryon incompatibility protein [Colletotrichum graminicola M1.001]EFQ32426.1 heterokaryon incompatibility protein [Colletotrichum graminicola M1.001]WDK14568.1 heterokaryon incompatibility protein [Colletotrichum graminicola]
MRQDDFIDKTVVPLATKWLEECGANHPSCGKPARHSTVFCTDNSLLISDLEGKGLVATRLLFFSLRPASDETDIARLQLSESLSPDTRYVALSHRWGAHETCCTTLGNLKDMIETGIRVSKLPATFRDAVYVGRGLGLSYIWIDSLCIVQDDKEDWKNEAQRMAIIYDNATCTIAANDGLDSDSGLAVHGSGLKSTNILDSRAWVCQERMVSPRSLIFTGGSVLWECRECDASVTSPGLEFRRTRGAEETLTHPKDIFVYFRDWRLPLKKEEPERVTEVEDDDDKGSQEGSESEQSDIEETEEIPKADAGALADTRPRRGSSEQQTASEKGETQENGGDGTGKYENDDAAFQKTLYSRHTTDGIVYHNGTPEPDPNAAPAAASDLRLGSEDATRRAEAIVFNHSEEGRESPEQPDSEYDSDGYPAYAGGLPGHAANLSVFLQGGRTSKPYRLYPEDLREGDPDPFGDFLVVVTDLDDSLRLHYWPFLKTWWSFLSNYSPLSLTYGSDKFLAINGITSVAQRWTHLRSSFGLFYHFLEAELMWYVDPDGPPGARQESWLVPTWSWASTRNARVKNDVYERYPLLGNIMIKPVITPAMGTAFDQPLPFAAWMARRYHCIEVKGDLRKGVVTAVQGADGKTRYPIVLDSVGRFSDEEVYDFRPDCAEDFPVGQPVNVLYMVWYHYDAKYFGLAEYIDTGLVLRQMKGEAEIGMYEEDVPKSFLSDQRLFNRLGYLETRYPVGSLRDSDSMSELNWYFARLA